ncbi:hypothetical protein BDV12DRAFT_197045 [Aspergillus spectabilis]
MVPHTPSDGDQPVCGRGSTRALWSSQDRKKLFDMRNKPEYKELSWINFHKQMQEMELQKLEPSPSHEVSNTRLGKRKRIDGDEEDEEFENSGDENNRGSKYMKKTAPEQEVSMGSMGARINSGSGTLLQHLERTDQRHTWSKTHAHMQQTQAQNQTISASPNHAASHITSGLATAPNTKAAHENNPISIGTTSHSWVPLLNPSTPIKQASRELGQYGTPQAAKAMRQPSVMGSTRMTDQAFVTTLQNFSCALTHTNERLAELKTENNLLWREIETMRQPLKQLLQGVPREDILSSTNRGRGLDNLSTRVDNMGPPKDQSSQQLPEDQQVIGETSSWGN